MTSLQQQRCDGCGATSMQWDIHREAGQFPAGWHFLEVKPLGRDPVFVDICADCWDAKPCSAVLHLGSPRRNPRGSA